jgi:hypothetical protein
VAGASIPAGKSCHVAVVFAPTVSGPERDMLRITGDMINSGLLITITGTGR